MTVDTLRKCMPLARDKDLLAYAGPLTAAMEIYDITTPKRQAAFLAQLAHESGSLRYKEEIASGEAYDTGSKAASLGNTPDKDGDGQRYKGRGPIQITGFSNYKRLSEELGYDFIKDPEALELPGAGSYAAGWFWQTHGLNELADVGNFRRITKRINGGYNGYEDRVEHWERIKKVLNAQ